MWGRNRKQAAAPEPSEAAAAPLAPSLKDAVRQARIENAERSGVVVVLRDAEAARLDVLNDALEPLFAEIPPEVELFDRGLSKGDPPRLWIDVLAHVVMARDKRTYRFVQDSRYGRKVLAESPDIPEMANAITRYVARRLVERERALADEAPAFVPYARYEEKFRYRRRWGAVKAFLFGIAVGLASLFAAAWIIAARQ